MALTKAIKYGKEHRVEYGTKGQPYCKAVDSTCRNHGGRRGGAANQCLWCLDNRTKKNKEKEKICKKEIENFKKAYDSNIIG